jgi:hypothetical protein
MSIESPADRFAVRLDDIDERALERKLKSFEADNPPVIEVHSSLASWHRLKVILLTLRASNIAPVVIMGPCPVTPTLDNAVPALCFLRDWDQLFLHNVLVLCDPWIPEELKKEFALEAKMELKWFREWFTASFDTRISKYPGLPWRAYIRKVVLENFGFTEKLLELSQAGNEESHAVELRNFLRGFLRSRKKTVALFPKKWSRLQ